MMASDTSSPRQSVGDCDSVAQAPSSSTSYEDLIMTSKERFMLTEVSGKGIGMVATLSIASGHIILSEAPILTCPTETMDASFFEQQLCEKLRKRSLEDRIFFASLTDAYNHPNAPLTGRIRTNSLPCGRNTKQSAIFRKIAMANHNCIPNAEYYWDACKRQGVLYALTDIEPHEEICICYVPMETHKERRKRLQDRFGFACVCKLCTLSKKERRQEDHRIREITTLQAELFNDPKELQNDPDGSFSKFQRLACLYEESFIDYDRDLTRLWAALADLCVTKYEEHRAVAKVMELTGMPMEDAEEIVNAWFADY